LAEDEFQQLPVRATKARALSPSEYVRTAVLGLPQFEVGSAQMQRETVNALIELAGAITASPAGPLRDLALERAIDAIDRFVTR
jgi:hypothetical protein